MTIDERTELASIPGTVAAIRHAYGTGRTRSLTWRHGQLDALIRILTDHGDELVQAMQTDFGKPEVEAYTTDIAFTLTEIRHLRKHVGAWMKPTKAKLSLAHRPGSGRVQAEPLGVALVIAPWNYPVQLLLAPMAAAFAAGNAVVAKPSELVPETSRVLAGLLRSNLDADAFAVFEGGPEVSTALLAQRWDHIFFTGSTTVGRIVARAAAEHLTPTILELGGKSPTIVTRTADVATAAHRIAWGKFLNAGQTCIAPDYVLVERSQQQALVDALVSAIGEFYGADPAASPHLTQIVNERHAERLTGLLADHGGAVVTGGQVDASSRKLAPTIVVDPDPDSRLMREEIFGPVLPVLAVDGVEEAVAFVNGREKPLALYVFSQDDAETRTIVDQTSSGGVCVNHTIFHIGPPSLPFGGVGESGMGRYHGRSGFDALSNLKPIMTKPIRPEISMMYPPYTKLKAKLLRKLV